MTQEDIVKIVLRHNISFTKLARELNITPQSLHYQLYLAKKFDAQLEKKIISVFEKYGITENNPNESSYISNQLLEHTSLTNLQLSILTQTIRNILKDDVITEDERQLALVRIRNFRKEVFDSLDELESLIMGERK
jgi:aminopeptidase C